MFVKINEEILNIINLIKSKGYEAYIVGGYLRDTLLNKENYDVDITTNAQPTSIKEMFKEYELNEKYINYGSVKFNLNKYHIEITTYRKEFNYINHRKPSKIEFTNNLEEDLIRRDFTINAICYDSEKIIDLFDGIRDLNKKIIKTINDPKERFKEDALRILRALKFSSKLGFKIDKKTDEAIKLNYKYLENINFNSIYKELKGILEGEYYLSILNKYNNILKEVFSIEELKTELFANEMSYEEKEALFFYYSKINIDNKYLINKEIEIINDKVDIKRKLKEYGYENIYNMLYFKNKYFNKYEKEFELLKEVIKNKECYNLKMLDINGNDLLKNNIKKEKIGNYLDILLEAVINNKCINDKNELLNYLKNINESFNI